MKGAKIDVRAYRERDGKHDPAWKVVEDLAAALDRLDPKGIYGAVTLERKGSSLLAEVGPRPEPPDEEEEDVQDWPAWAGKAIEHLIRFPQSRVRVEDTDDDGYQLLFPTGAVYGKDMGWTGDEAERWADRINKDQYPPDLRRVFEELLEEVPRSVANKQKRNRWH